MLKKIPLPGLNYNMKVVDNFLEYHHFLAIKHTLSSDTFPWFFNDYKVDVGDDYFQFIHYLYKFNSPTSELFNMVIPLLEKLEVKSLIRIKCNLTTKTEKIIEYEMHQDQNFDCKTSIFYVNTNNGYTKFESGEIINSVENRIVTFPTLTDHTGTSCSDEKIRLVININYF